MTEQHLLFVTKEGGNCPKLPVNISEEDKGEIQEVTAITGAAEEFSMDAAGTAVSSELVAISRLIEEPKTVLKTFFSFLKKLWCIAAHHRALTYN